MKLDNIVNDPGDHEDKIESLIKSVFSRSENIFADKYCIVRDLVLSLSSEERLVLVNKVREMYSGNPNAA